ncbi:hypothetical protein [Rhodanobacter umsongensis]
MTGPAIVGGNAGNMPLPPAGTRDMPQFDISKGARGLGRTYMVKSLDHRSAFQNNQLSEGQAMTDVIDFLEQMGQDAQLRHASQDEVELALTSAEIAPELQAPILVNDPAQLETLLGQVPLCAMFFPGQEDEEEGGEDEETPSKEPDEAPEHSGLRTVIPTA